MKSTTARGLDLADRQYLAAIRDNRPYMIPARLGQDIQAPVVQAHVIGLARRAERRGLVTLTLGEDGVTIVGVTLTPHGAAVAAGLPGAPVHHVQLMPRPAHPTTARVPREEYEHRAATAMGVTVEALHTTHEVRPCRQCDTPETCQGWRAAQHGEPAALRALIEARSIREGTSTPEPDHLAAYETVNVGAEQRGSA